MRCGLLKAQRWDVESKVRIRPKPSGARPNKKIDVGFRKGDF